MAPGVHGENGASVMPHAEVATGQEQDLAPTQSPSVVAILAQVTIMTLRNVTQKLASQVSETIMCITMLQHLPLSTGYTCQPKLI